MWLGLPFPFSIFTVESDLGRPGVVYVFASSPRMALAVDISNIQGVRIYHAVTLAHQWL